jgi:hypothetical protein
MKKHEWLAEYADIIVSCTGITYGMAWDVAEANYDDYHEDHTPSEAVSEELSCWGD